MQKIKTKKINRKQIAKLGLCIIYIILTIITIVFLNFV